MLHPGTGVLVWTCIFTMASLVQWFISGNFLAIHLFFFFQIVYLLLKGDVALRLNKFDSWLKDPSLHTKFVWKWEMVFEVSKCEKCTDRRNIYCDQRLAQVSYNEGKYVLITKSRKGIFIWFEGIIIKACHLHFKTIKTSITLYISPI